MGLDIKVDTIDLARLGNMIGAAGPKANAAMAMALNDTGRKARTRMIRVLAPQTGLKQKVIRKALKTSFASKGSANGVSRGASLVFDIKSRGGDIALKYFKARETRKGVSAAPRSVRSVFAGTFIKGGLFPNRVDLGRGGQVFRRVGKARLPIVKAKSGVFIPIEMVSGASREAFYAGVATDLPARLEHHLSRILG